MVQAVGEGRASDDGYFGPGSLTWRVLADPAAGPGGLRALFLQALHPLAMAGIDQHSGFAQEFWPRLHRTAEYVMTVGFGSRDEVDAMAARVRRVHGHVRGVDPVTGRPYAARDPELLRWVHVTEVDSFLDAVRRAGAGLTDDEADAFLAEQVRAAELLGAADVPASRADVAEYYAEVRGRLRASGTSRRAALRLLLPPMSTRVTLTTPARPVWATVATLGFALQPRWARRMHGTPGLPTTDVAATAALRSLRAAAMVVPDEWRHSPRTRAALAREAGLAAAERERAR